MDVRRRLDETIPGGRYLAADGVTYVNAWGEPIAEPAAPAAPADAPAAEPPADRAPDAEADAPTPKRTRRSRKKDAE